MDPERYEILGICGQGGRAIVYKAIAKTVNSAVAVKQLRTDVAVNLPAIVSFKREAKITSNLRCPQIVPAFGFGVDETNGAPYLVLDFVDGPTLKQVLEERGRISIEMLRVMAKDGPDALQHLHENKILHSDLKPSKFMFSNVVGNLTMKLIGFGRAKSFPQASVAEGEHEGQDEFCPLYSSPEQFLGRPLGPASDIYSFGCVLYEALTGAPPFCGESPLETASMHLHYAPMPPSEFASDPSLEPLDPVLLKCLAKEPEERYATAVEVGQALLAIPAIGGRTPATQATTSGGWKKLFGLK
jgi:eukaryotic-like serine/threonine-protein kinase